MYGKVLPMERLRLKRQGKFEEARKKADAEKEAAFERRKIASAKRKAIQSVSKGHYFSELAKNRAENEKTFGPSQPASSSAPSTPSSEDRGEVIRPGGMLSFKKGGMVKKASSKGGSSCVGIAKRGFGKALRKSR